MSNGATRFEVRVQHLDCENEAAKIEAGLGGHDGVVEGHHSSVGGRRGGLGGQSGGRAGGSPAEPSSSRALAPRRPDAGPAVRDPDLPARPPHAGVESAGVTTTPDLKPRSRDVTDGLEKAAARGMLRAVGLGDEDFAKPQLGIASSWNEITPCNLSLQRLAQAAKEGVHAAGGYPLEFGTISVTESDRFGVTRNPWNPEYTPGGSSGGAGAAVASGMAPIAHASDGGGSIRIPASCNGLVGLKPSRNRITDRVEYMTAAATSGVVTRTVGDTAALLDVLSVVDPGAWNVAPPAESPFVSEVKCDPGRLRIRVLEPASATLSVHAWSDEDPQEFRRGWRVDVAGGQHGYTVELSEK